MAPEYRPVETDAHRAALHRILFRSFGHGDTEDSLDVWLSRPGQATSVVVDGDEVVAGLMRIPMGQWFGGRSVPTLGIAAVGVDPGARRRGIGKLLMSRCLAGAREDGFALSSLYASTYGLYRSVGYERALGRYSARVRLADLPRGGGELGVRAVGDDDERLVRELVGRLARHDGHLDRGDYVWERALRPHGVKATYGWLVTDGERPVGYARWHQAPAKGDHALYDLHVLDVAAEDTRAAERLLTLFADHSTMGGEVRWPSAPNDPLLWALPDRQYGLRLLDLQFLRIVDVARALEARGWPAGVSGELHLELEDEILPENAGRWVLRVEGGEARVERGGEGRLALSTRSLVALYSGSLTPEELATRGWLRGEAAERAVAAALFAGPAPWCPDMF